MTRLDYSDAAWWCHKIAVSPDNREGTAQLAGVVADLAARLAALERMHPHTAHAAAPAPEMCACGHTRPWHDTPKATGTHSWTRLGCDRCGCVEFLARPATAGERVLAQDAAAQRDRREIEEDVQF